MTTISKFLAIAALVGGIGGALASQGQQDACTERGTSAYQKVNPSAPDPTQDPSSDPNMQAIPGLFGEDYECVDSNNNCRWLYEPAHPEANEFGWIPCDGDLTDLDL